MKTRQFLISIAFLGLLSLCLPAVAAGGVMFQDDFSADAPGRWTVVDEGTNEAPSKWARHRGAFVQQSNINSSDAPKYSGTYAVAGEAGWRDYTFSLILRSQDNDGIGIIFRYHDAKNYYRFRWSGAKSQWNGRVLDRVVDGQWTTLASDKVGYTDNVYHNVIVRLAGERITLYVDDMTTPVFDVHDAGSSLTQGKIGLYCWGNTGSFFDNVAVYANDAQSPFPLRRTYLVTAAGRAFVDDNRNGIWDAGEAPLPGLIVSDGRQLTVTDAQGAYTLADINPFVDHFVFVQSPSGYRPLNGFYRRVPEEAETMTADFTFTAAPETANPDFSFVQITDLHVANEPQTLLDDLTEIARLEPAFVIATGDLIDNGGDRRGYENYVKAISQSPVPVISGIGNHDAVGIGVDYFEEYLGPTCYAFDYGGRHFVLFNCLGAEVPQRMEWLQQELALQPKEKEVLLFQHYPPTAQMMALLSRFNTVAVYTGHWHSSKTVAHGEHEHAILSVTSPTLRFGGIDTSPRGFRVTTFKGGKMALESRYGGVARHMALVSPADGETVPKGPVTFEVSAYDSGWRAAEVAFQLDGGPWRAMQAAGSANWQATMTMPPGRYTVRARVTFADGSIAERQGQFTVGDAEAPAPKPGQDWPMFQRTPARNGVTSEAVTPPLHPVWRTNIGGVTHISSPVVAGDTVYIGAADEDNRGQAGVYALDAGTGAVRWHFPTATSVKHTVAVADGLVFAAGVDGTIYGIEAATGTERWRYSLGDPLQRWMFSAPVVLDGVVYAGVGPSFAALEAATGKELWHSKALGTDWISGLCSPAADADRVYVPVNWSKGLSALDRKTGALLWNANKGFRTSHATPVLAGGTLYYPADGNLHALDPATGAERWSFQLPGGWTISTPAVAGGMVLTGGGEGKLYALDAATGREIWRFQTGKALLDFSPYQRSASPVIGSPAVSGNVVFLGGVDGKLYALALKTGKLQWSYQLGTPITASPAVSGNTVYLSTFDGTVYAFR